MTAVWVKPTAADGLAGRRGLSLVDCVSFAVMARAGLRQAFAFDDHFAERGFSCLPAAADPQAGPADSPV